MFEPWDVLESLGPFDGIVPSLMCILTKQHGVRSGKYLLKNPGNAISETGIFKMFLASSALKNLCLWCKFQSRLLFIISLLLKTFWQPCVSSVVACYPKRRVKKVAKSQQVYMKSGKFESHRIVEKCHVRMPLIWTIIQMWPACVLVGCNH